MNDEMPLVEIAVVGMALRVPGADNLDTFWDNLCSGVESLTRLEEPVEPRRGYVPVEGALDRVREFDAALFGMTPREAALTDPQHRLFLECAFAALEDAGCDPHRFDGSVGVYAGCSANSYLPLHLLTHPDLAREMQVNPALLHANDKDYLATRLSYKLDLRGPSMTVQTACSTSLVAVAEAAQALLDFRCDLAIAGASSVRLPLGHGYEHVEGGIFARDGHCRPFDAQASGTVFSSGVGVVVLRRLTDALADRDRVYAVVRGFAVNNDGADKVGFTAPSPTGQAQVIAEALELADIDPETVDFVEGHGTGTTLGDPIEVAALVDGYGHRRPSTGPVLLGSVKSNLGHLNAASGVVGLAKAVLAVHRGEIPATVNFDTLNPLIEVAEDRLVVNRHTRPWPAREHPRRAGVSSFGMGGTNCHVVVEQPPPPEPQSTQPQTSQLFVVSAAGPESLDRRLADIRAVLDQPHQAARREIAYTLAERRGHLSHRAAFVVREDATTSRVVRGRRQAHRPRVGLVFPGQGCQFPGMALQVAGRLPVFQEALARSLGLFPAEVGAALQADEFPTDTAVVQPALFAVELAAARAAEQIGVSPDWMVGHSLGDWVAATIAGVFDEADAARLVSLRARLMQSMPPGAMLSVAADREVVQRWLGDDVTLAVTNAPDRHVVGGSAPSIERLGREMQAAGVTVRRLPVSHAFHTASMNGAIAPLREAIGQCRLGEPDRPLASSRTGAWLRPDEARDPAFWAEQVRQPVELDRALATACGDAADILIEAGPDAGLSAGLRRNLSIAGGSILGRSGDDETEACLLTFGSAWSVGADLSWAALGVDVDRVATLPAYPFADTTHGVDPPDAALRAQRDTVPAQVTASGRSAPAAQASASASASASTVFATVERLWCDLLGVPSVNPEDHFLDQGDSLTVTQLVSRIRDTYAVELTIDQVLDNASVAGIARLTADALVDAAGAGATSA